MKSASKVVSAVALFAVLFPSVLFFAGVIELSVVKFVAIAGTLVWFASTPVWMGAKEA